ncbi:hypothetical protein CVT26_006781 [Gymnopilus dilepis]|uniref:Uncharacterized protein n=1 Tax=Gymnopilus dilepis TaxID=231916 RepID=A0A409Y307_9AGAR|nr:hypothetical protein CVT26_006781 [Gymnopilus dilepis]
MLIRHVQFPKYYSPYQTKYEYRVMVTLKEDKEGKTRFLKSVMLSRKGAVRASSGIGVLYSVRRVREEDAKGEDSKSEDSEGGSGKASHVMWAWTVIVNVGTGPALFTMGPETAENPSPVSTLNV